jgi:hypothetical protein
VIIPQQSRASDAISVSARANCLKGRELGIFRNNRGIPTR